MRKYSLVAVLLTGCAFAPPDATSFQPPAAYRELWAQAEACSGRNGDYNDLRFFTVPGYAFESPKADSTVGWTVGHNIYLAEDWATDTFIVRHEMLHALTGDGHPEHPWVTPCRATWESRLR